MVGYLSGNNELPFPILHTHTQMNIGKSTWKGKPVLGTLPLINSKVMKKTMMTMMTTTTRTMTTTIAASSQVVDELAQMAQASK